MLCNPNYKYPQSRWKTYMNICIMDHKFQQATDLFYTTCSPQNR